MKGNIFLLEILTLKFLLLDLYSLIRLRDIINIQSLEWRKGKASYSTRKEYCYCNNISYAFLAFNSSSHPFRGTPCIRVHIYNTL